MSSAVPRNRLKLLGIGITRRIRSRLPSSSLAPFLPRKQTHLYLLLLPAGSLSESLGASRAGLFTRLFIHRFARRYSSCYLPCLLTLSQRITRAPGALLTCNRRHGGHRHRPASRLSPANPCRHWRPASTARPNETKAEKPTAGCAVSEGRAPCWAGAASRASRWADNAPDVGYVETARPRHRAEIAGRECAYLALQNG